MLSIVGSVLALGLCQNWSEAEEIGSLDHKLAPEASGIAVSRAFDDRLYHVSDSGSDGHFVVSGASGNNARRIKLKGFSPTDAEDLALGTCGRSGGDCLFIGDIGDNDAVRSEIGIAIVREKSEFAPTETPLRVIRMRYPDGAHNAEGLAVHPNGDIYLVTKGQTATLYKLAAAAWQVESNGPFTLKRVGDLDLGDAGDDSLVTSFDISPDGNRFLLLTYKDAYEFELDLSKQSGKVSALIPRRITLETLKKQESIAYLPDGMGFVYSTESKKKDGPLMQVNCAD